MSSNTSGYRNFMYRYYRCRSTAGGTPPCKGVRVPAWEIEQFAVRTLNGLDYAAVGHEIEQDRFDQFKTWWIGLNEEEQWHSLREVVRRVVWNQDTGIEVALSVGEFSVREG